LRGVLTRPLLPHAPACPPADQRRHIVRPLRIVMTRFSLDMGAIDSYNPLTFFPKYLHTLRF